MTMPEPHNASETIKSLSEVIESQKQTIDAILKKHADLQAERNALKEENERLDSQIRDCLKIEENNAKEITTLKAENKRLRERLEMGYAYTLDGKKVECKTSESTDGVASRDATIELLEREIKKVKAQADALCDALEWVDCYMHDQKPIPLNVCGEVTEAINNYKHKEKE